MDAFTKFIAERAFKEGRAAYQAGHSRHAPERFGVYSGDWVRGWEDAALLPAQPEAA